MEEGLFHNPVFVDYVSEYAVAVIGHGQSHTEIEVADPVTRTMIKVCPRYPTIPCDVHVRAAQEARGGFEFRGVPASFVCDSSGKQLEKVPGMAPQKFIDALKAAQMKIGKPPITGSMIAKMGRDLLKGDSYVAKGKFERALKCYQEVAEDEDVPEFLRAQGKARVEGLEATVLEAIEEAKALEPRKAKRALKKLEREVDPFPEAKQALEEAQAELDAK